MQVREPVLNRPVLDDLAVTKAPQDHRSELNMPPGRSHSPVWPSVGSRPLQADHNVISRGYEIFDVRLQIRETSQPAQDMTSRALWPNLYAVAHKGWVEDEISQPDVSCPALGEPSPSDVPLPISLRMIAE